MVDINPVKRGRHLAGTAHEIVGPDDLGRIDPAVVVVMNPIYVEEVTAAVRSQGIDAEIVPL